MTDIKSKNEDWVSTIIVDDDISDEEVFKNTPLSNKTILQDCSQQLMSTEVVEKKKRVAKGKTALKPMFTADTTIIEIGIDEAGRGPMFGRVYAGVAVYVGVAVYAARCAGCLARHADPG